MLGSHEAARRNSFGHGRAPGSVLDRCSELLGLVPPGQPDGAIAIDLLAGTRHDWQYRDFPVTEQLNRTNGYDYDFHALYEEVAHQMSTDCRADVKCLAVSAQECVMRILLTKAFAAAKALAAPQISFGGGVTSNSRLRTLASEYAARTGLEVHFPPIELCVDNARMIAFAGLLAVGGGLAGPGSGR
jgi:N6-L-threonylcarbamoyladenine synthase